jgi:hypothetical protein
MHCLRQHLSIDTFFSKIVHAFTERIITPTDKKVTLVCDRTLDRFYGLSLKKTRTFWPIAIGVNAMVRWSLVFDY